jgi:hypothetical protein
MTPVTEETLVLCMILALAVGALVGFALGYILKEKRHDDEIAAVIRITKRISETNRETATRKAAKKERAPQSGAPHDMSRIRF